MTEIRARLFAQKSGKLLGMWGARKQDGVGVLGKSKSKFLPASQSTAGC